MSKGAESIDVALPNDIPSGWRRTSLGEIGEYINGRGFKKSEWTDKGLPIIRIQNLTGSGKDQNYYDGEIDERHVVNHGDLLISWAATLGAYLWTGPRAALNQHIFKVYSFVDKKFHFYLMQHILGDLCHQTHGSGMVHITKSKFDSMPVLVPETEDQQRDIVAEIEKQFSRLDEAVANLKRVKANLKRYKAAVLKAAVEGRLVETEAERARREGRSYETGAQLLQRILETRRSQWKGKGKYKEPAAPDTTDLPELPEGWVVASLEQLTSSERVICYGILMPKEDVPDGVLYIKVRDLKGDKVNLDSLQRTSPEIAAKYARASLKTGDLLLAIRGTYGRIAEVPPELEGGNITQDTARLAVSPLIDRNYVAWFLRSLDAQNFFKRVARGVAVKGVNIADVRVCPIFLPSLSEQRRIVAEVDRRLSLLRETEAQTDSNLQRAERMRQSMLASAFSGRIRTGETKWQMSNDLGSGAAHI